MTETLRLENMHGDLVWRYGLLHMPSGDMLRIDNAEDMDALEAALAPPEGWESVAALQAAYGDMVALLHAAEAERDEALGFLAETRRHCVSLGEQLTASEAERDQLADRLANLPRMPIPEPFAVALHNSGWLTPEEAEALRAERDEARASAIASLRTQSEVDRYAAEKHAAALEAERDDLRTELERWTSGRRVKGRPQVESVPDGITYAARLARSIGTEGGEDHDRLLADAAQRLKGLSDVASTLLAEAVVLRGERDDLAVALDREHAIEKDHHGKLVVVRREQSQARNLLLRVVSPVFGTDLGNLAKTAVADIEANRKDLAKVIAQRDAAMVREDAMRPVVEAAKVWRAQFPKPVKFPRMAALIAAVDALSEPDGEEACGE